MEYLQAQEITARYMSPSIGTKHPMTLVKDLETEDVWEEKSAVVLLAAAAAVEVETKLEADLKASVVTEDENDMACKWRKDIRPAITRRDACKVSGNSCEMLLSRAYQKNMRGEENRRLAEMVKHAC
jgi:hypothetical protein